MAFSYPKKFTSAKYPKFIKTRSELKKTPKIAKVFSSLGIKDFQTDCDNLNKPVSINTIVKELKVLIETYEEHIDNFCETNGTYRFDIKLCNNNECYFCKDRKEIKILIKAITAKSIINSKNKFILPVGSLGCRKGSSLLKFIELLKEGMDYHEDDYDINITEAITVFQNNSEGKKLKIVFSSNGMEAAWDMATMSMRGISSCQGWSGSYKQCLVGSIVDPCAGIIYITDGTQTKYGSRMLARSVVRFVVCGRNNNELTWNGALGYINTSDFVKSSTAKYPSVIAIENAYIPGLKGAYKGDKYTKIFKEALSKYFPKNKIVILDNARSYGTAHDKYVIPMLGNVSKLKEASRSYSDADLEYVIPTTEMKHLLPKEIKSFIPATSK